MRLAAAQSLRALSAAALRPCPRAPAAAAAFAAARAARIAASRISLASRSGITSGASPPARAVAAAAARQQAAPRAMPSRRSWAEHSSQVGAGRPQHGSQDLAAAGARLSVSSGSHAPSLRASHRIAPLQSNPKEAQVTHSDIELDVDFDTHVLSGHVEVREWLGVPAWLAGCALCLLPLPPLHPLLPLPPLPQLAGLQQPPLFACLLPHACRAPIRTPQHTVAVKADGVGELHLDTREVAVSGVTVNGQRELPCPGCTLGGTPL